MNFLPSKLVLAIFLLQMPFTPASFCNLANGPEDDFTCGRSTCCTPMQWFRCVSEETLKKIDEGYNCLGHTGFCPISCSLEYFGYYELDVAEECKCNPDDEDYLKNRTIPKLQQECYKPSGNDCSWYRNCLAQRYDCKNSEGGEHEYALTFGEKYCNRYNEKYSYFSSYGQKWIDSVRKCLQEKLVLKIRPYDDYNCSEIKDYAFESHIDCYTSPPGHEGFCSLPWKDYLKVLWTIYPAFFKSFISGLQVFGKCSINYYNKKMAFVYNIDYSYRYKYKTNSDKEIDPVKFPDITESLYELIRRELRVDDFSQFSIFTIADSPDTQSFSLNVSILLADQNSLKFDIESKVLPEYKIKMTELFSNGKLLLEIGDLIFEPSNFYVCEDFSCKNQTDIKTYTDETTQSPLGKIENDFLKIQKTVLYDENSQAGGMDMWKLGFIASVFILIAFATIYIFFLKIYRKRLYNHYENI